jgi:1-acyl-sn-glycerol-3-phosphate acyltransferase
MRTLLVFLTLITMTPLFGFMVIISALFGVEDREGGIYDNAPRWWAACLVWAAGIRVRLHNAERMQSGAPRIFVSNHISWFDVLTLASVLPRYKFVGKAELFRIPIFGRAARAAGMIAIHRENRKSAFESYRVAAERIRAGASVVVFPEGTRGRDYRLREFKKGPFVLAVAAGVPIVPTIVHGTIEVMPRGSFFVRSHVVNVHFLEPIPADGLTYEDRNRLSRAAWDRMASVMRELYGVESVATTTPAREGATAAD